MSLLEIELIRHVKVAGKPALYGSTDIGPLTAENDRLLAQLITQQKTKKAYQSIICSPLQRCQIIAKKFAQACQLPLQVCDDLQEMNFGIFDGVAFDSIAFESSPVESNTLAVVDFDESQTLHWPLLEAFFQAPATVHLPKAEPLACFHGRVIRAWQRLIAQQVSLATEQRKLSQSVNFQSIKSQPKSSQTRSPRRVLVIAHGGVIRMIIAHILQLDWQQASWHQQLKIANGSITRINLSQPYDNNKIFQQISTIAMPFLKDPHDGN